MTEDEQGLAERITTAVHAIAGQWDDLMEPPSTRAAGHSAKTAHTSDADMDWLTRVVSMRREITDSLRGWCRVVMEDRQITSGRALPLGNDVPGMCAFLDRHAEWIAGQDFAQDSAEEIEDWAQKVTAAVAPRRREWHYIGACPFVLLDPEGGGVFCSGRIRVAVADGTTEAACSEHGGLAPIEWWADVLGLSLSRIVGTEDLRRELAARLHVEVTSRTLQLWARSGQITQHIPFGPLEDPARKPRALWFDLATALEQVAMLGRECVTCGAATHAGPQCLRCLAAAHHGPLFAEEKPGYVVGSVALAPAQPLPLCVLDERERCEESGLPTRWCRCASCAGVGGR